MAQENISAQLNDLLASRDFQPELLDKEGRPTDAENADIFTFDFVSRAGKNYGTMVIILDSDNEMQVFYGDNLGRSMEGDDKTEFFDFVQHLHKFANMRRWTYSPKNINQVKYTMQGLAAIKEGLFEGYYGTRKVSYSGEPTEARLVIQHNRTLGEADARFRYVESLFIETADSERYRLQFKNLAGGRAMLEHVRQGGKPYDVRGCHITEMVSEIATLSRFNRASAGRVLEGVTAELVTEAQQYYRGLRENLKRMASTRGYQAYFESWHPAETTLQEELVDSIKTMFVEQTLDSRIEAALPVLARLQQESKKMKEAEIFESWVEQLSEGTWALPDTPEKYKRLQDLMSRELIVGPDATNATEQLGDLVGDDRLFDYLEDLAARDPRANVWDDTDVQARLGDLGIQLPGMPPENNEDDVAADAAAATAQQPPVQESHVKELGMDLEGRFAGDTHIDIGGIKLKPLEVGDIVKYFGEKAKILALAKDQGLARISIESGYGGSVRTVKISDLKQLGQGMAEEQLDEINWKKAAATGAMALGALGAAGSSQARVTVGPDVQMSPSFAQQMHQQGSQSSVGHSGGQIQNIDTAEKVERNDSGVVVHYDDKQYKGVLVAKDAPTPRGAKKIKITQAQMGERGIGNYTTYLLPNGTAYIYKLDSQIANEGVAEGSGFDKWADDRAASQLHKLKKPHPETWHDVDKKLGKAVDKMSQAEKVKKGLAHPDTLKKKGVAEANTCNHTQEGEMCPEHGLAECGTYESQVRESNAQLARLKSLAHGR